MKLQFDSLKLISKPKENLAYEDMNCVFSASTYAFNSGKLFLGNIHAANDKQLLKQNRIGAVLSVIDTSEINLEPNIKRLWFVVEDENEFPLSKYFDQSVEFIKQQLLFTNVLVHCYAGISRSASIVLAYLIRAQNMTLDQSLKYVRQSRPAIVPNSGFIVQLQEYEQNKFQVEKKVGLKSFLNPNPVRQKEVLPQSERKNQESKIVMPQKEYQSESKTVSFSFIFKQPNVNINESPKSPFVESLNNFGSSREKNVKDLKRQLEEFSMSHQQRQQQVQPTGISSMRRVHTLSSLKF